MALSKSTRIIILLVIDIAFFLLELITGYSVHSLALVADSFHMLNDVLSLCVGLWAVKVANTKASSSSYTYGWQRAETLGALVNGVFLVALCVTIFLDAIQRFVEPQVVSNPMLVLIVGCLGLGSNLLGLVLFHDHGHSHGGHGHSHGGGHEADGVKDAEEGHAHARGTSESGNVVDALPQNRIAGWPQTERTDTESSEATAVDVKPSSSKGGKGHKHTRSRSRGFSSFEDFPIAPNAFRRSIIDASRLDPVDSDEDAENVVRDDQDDTQGHADQPLLNGKQKSENYGSLTPAHPKHPSISHADHKHEQPKEPGKGHGHSHGDLNMRGIFLHVLGDALGNIGVIASALVIWLTDYTWRFYFDPAISLVITLIILASAIPLCKAASRILLQAVPAGISVDDIQADITTLPGIVSCHHVHVWQLSDTKLVASLHVQVAFPGAEHTAASDAASSARYMQLAVAIRRCLHAYGIHSSTIQPEFCLDPAHDHSAASDEGGEGGSAAAGGAAGAASQRGSKAGSVTDADACLLECGDECGGGKSCCAPATGSGSGKGEETGGGHGGHGHAH